MKKEINPKKGPEIKKDKFMKDLGKTQRSGKDFRAKNGRRGN